MSTFKIYLKAISFFFITNWSYAQSSIPFEIKLGSNDFNDSITLTNNNTWKIGNYQFFSNNIYRGLFTNDNTFISGFYTDSFGEQNIRYYGNFQNAQFTGCIYSDGLVKVFIKNNEIFNFLIKSKNISNIPSKESNSLTGTYSVFYKNGDFYEGNLFNGRRSTFGIYITKDGYIYIGTWYRNNRKGKSTAIFENGKGFIGVWDRDKIDGEGIYFSPNSINSNYIYSENKKGLWRSGQLVELSDNLTQDLSNDIIYYLSPNMTLDDYIILEQKNEQKVIENDEYLIGKSYAPETNKSKSLNFSGGAYKGQTVNGQFHGKGLIIYENGDYYVGNFFISLFRGDGTYYFKNGDYLKGNFLPNSRFSGEYRNDGDVKYGVELLFANDSYSVKSPLNQSDFRFLDENGNLINDEIKINYTISNNKNEVVNNLEENIENESKSKKEAVLQLILFIIIGFVVIKFIKSIKTKTPNAHKFEKSIELSEKTDNFRNSQETKVPYQRKLIQDQLNELRGSETTILWVDPKYRTNPLSLKEGGCTVVVIKTVKEKNGHVFGYDNIKEPKEYVQMIYENYISNHKSNIHFPTIEEYYKEIYAMDEGNDRLEIKWSTNMNKPLEYWDN